MPLPSPDTTPLIQALQGQANALLAQVECLRQPAANDTHALVLAYVLMRSAGRVAEWAREHGFTMAGSAGTRRQAMPADVLAAVRAPAEPVPPVLLAMAAAVLGSNRKEAERRFS